MCRWFDSGSGHSGGYGALAQSVEHLTFNQVVRGSNPRCLSEKRRRTLETRFSVFLYVVQTKTGAFYSAGQKGKMNYRLITEEQLPGLMEIPLKLMLEFMPFCIRVPIKFCPQEEPLPKLPHPFPKLLQFVPQLFLPPFLKSVSQPRPQLSPGSVQHPFLQSADTHTEVCPQLPEFIAA